MTNLDQFRPCHICHRQPEWVEDHRQPGWGHYRCDHGAKVGILPSLIHAEKSEAALHWNDGYGSTRCDRCRTNLKLRQRHIQPKSLNWRGKKRKCVVETIK